MVNNIKGLSTSQVKLYLTNSSIQYTVPGGSNAGTYTVPVPNAVVTFNPASGSFKTSYDLTNNRWSTSVTWSAAFSTDEPGISFQWGWSAGIYNSSFGGGTCPSGSAVCPSRLMQAPATVTCLA